jgi:hypothetical protein
VVEQKGIKESKITQYGVKDKIKAKYAGIAVV